MKHIFIVNPIAGRGSVQNKLIQKLQSKNLDYHVTESVGEAEQYTRKICESNPTEKIRFFACGGDGTLNEVMNGVFGFENVEVGIVPIGSGNDFIRNFEIPLENFLDIDKQISGSAVLTDVIKYEDIGNSTANYAINMFNIGFDCNVVVKMAKIKRYPLIRGSLAYMLSIFITLIKKDGANLVIEFEDGTSYDGHVLLTAIGNGAFCGGGLKGVAYAECNDGLMDVCVIKDVSRLKIISLLSRFADGTYLGHEPLQKYITYKKCKTVKIERNETNHNLCVDGEIKTMGKTLFKVVPTAIKFVIPSL
jgi:YegS/Rv2252/BmrU family lipid kinase